MAYIYNESGDCLNFRFKDSAGNIGYSNMAWIVESIQSFQTGVNTLYNKCVSCGVTPSAKTPTAISTAIQSIYNNGGNITYWSGAANNAPITVSITTGVIVCIWESSTTMQGQLIVYKDSANYAVHRNKAYSGYSWSVTSITNTSITISPPKSAYWTCYAYIVK